MFTNPAQANPLQDLARTLTQIADTNKDGKISTEEFTAFLTRLLGGLQGPSAQASSAQSLSPYGALLTVGLGGAAHLHFEGFDFGRPMDIQKSAKDAFAHFAKASGTMPRTKVEAEQWFNQHIRQQMQALGHSIQWVQGDKFQFTNWQGTFVVDFVRNADGSNPALAWQADYA